MLIVWKSAWQNICVNVPWEKKGNDAGGSYFLKIPESGTREAWKDEMMQYTKSIRIN